ncbi:S-adenosylmethionine tRNA ribosyltransferase-isomerase [Caenispirillum salinarum AK4]|uniref:S-adenosylmethionine:tRNA ribosyltransferase-isomerase n=1 Tax=Caenispirillum salinarum AK4 TaxID=1238182 RepID=K9HJ73_9PROT|nr:tRNA preQ1(34) S-adenosylmethionine ribosyltransferase-isomerase QueA [Caenispirillum salinarum]EKV30443.1 S-adenosylmethionine tRNA ribosyltransferase-isomerase [Caenispirillum salinarum AK4]
MRVDAFDFDLPRDRIADRPASPRDSARCLRVTCDGLADFIMRDLPDMLQPGDVMVFNDTRVIPARLAGRRGEAKVEVTLHMRLDDDTWRAFAKGAKKLKVGQTIDFADGFSALVEERDGGDVRLKFNRGGQALMDALKDHGHIPLPPYMGREDDESDRTDYQTVYSAPEKEGAVAAPTAGLHFTPELLERLDKRGVTRVFVTLHVGAGTFLPVTADDTADHKMHSEIGEITPEAAEAIEAARARGGRVVAVGTTALRLLESAADAETGAVKPFSGPTDIFITPGWRFRAVDKLMTNFHLPKSTLFMLVSAFSGLNRMKAAYAHAIQSGYRFYSYGDGSLLDRCDADLSVSE